ncbi:hypothetical protein ZIOFF_063031 [Zingiber officinale]|uniref:UDP-N-acetylglucosamine--peptide N-acetylglucosaminyltransferase SPINDLY n=1 Tax=Zingiber officinale TaxID=94328 RepID=A0A8J5KFV3_ZINOF|nr:hypothetical protein ZIOFF_063031 [Zingiber officinale]
MKKGGHLRSCFFSPNIALPPSPSASTKSFDDLHSSTINQSSILYSPPHPLLIKRGPDALLHHLFLCQLREVSSLIPVAGSHIATSIGVPPRQLFSNRPGQNLTAPPSSDPEQQPLRSTKSEQQVYSPIVDTVFIMSTMHWGYLDAGNLAGIYYEQSQLDMAIMHYKQAINCDSTFIEAYNNLGNALKDVGHVEEAINFYRSCLALQPNHPQALSSLGNIYMDCNMMSVAASFYKATLAVTTGISAPFNNLAIIYKPTMPEAHANLASAYTDSLQISSTPELKLMKCGSSGLNAC